MKPCKFKGLVGKDEMLVGDSVTVYRGPAQQQPRGQGVYCIETLGGGMLEALGNYRCKEDLQAPILFISASRGPGRGIVTSQ